MNRKIKKIQARIMALTVAGNIVKAIAWIAMGGIIINGLLHIERYGLKHLIYVIWLGPGE